MRLIDADALLEKLRRDPLFEFVEQYGISGVIDNAPTIDAVPVRHGKWIYGNDFHWYMASCSACGYQRRTDIKATGWNQWKYCPNCGAKMDAERRG